MYNKNPMARQMRLCDDTIIGMAGTPMPAGPKRPEARRPVPAVACNQGFQIHHDGADNRENVWHSAFFPGEWEGHCGKALTVNNRAWKQV
jgi:hypothetical protein